MEVLKVPNRIQIVTLSPNHSMFQPALGDRIASGIGDWIRISAFSWLIWTDKSTEEVSQIFRQTLGLQANFVVLYVDPAGAQGWAPKWIWDWINNKQTLAQGLGGLGPFPNFPTR